MSQVVAVSGTQGGGKSTLLAGLKACGWKVDDFKVSRAVQAQLGWESLSQVMESPSTMMRFQQEVFRQKLERDTQLRSEAADFVLTERSFADIAAYTTYWCWEHVDRRNWDFHTATAWLTPFLKACHVAQVQTYSAVIIIPFMSDVRWENDPNRASLSSVQTIHEDVTRFMDISEMSGVRQYTITATGKVERVEQAEAFLRTL
jgi:predicted ATPase